MNVEHRTLNVQSVRCAGQAEFHTKVANATSLIKKDDFSAPNTKRGYL
jgi:hypothetical protein